MTAGYARSDLGPIKVGLWEAQCLDCAAESKVGHSGILGDPVRVGKAAAIARARRHARDTGHRLVLRAGMYQYVGGGRLAAER